jgi:hypothetical protein
MAINTSAFAFIPGPGLTGFVNPGNLFFSGVASTVALTSVTLTANATNSVYVDLQSGTVTSGTSGFPLASIPIATVVTDPTNITSIVDNRPDLAYTGKPLVGFATLSGTTTAVIPMATAGLFAELEFQCRITFYGGADIVSLRFGNGTTIDAGNNYNYRWITAAAGGTTFAGGVDATADSNNSLIKIAAQTATISRVIEGTITNTTNKNKVINMRATLDTAGIATLPAIDLGSGIWFNTAGSIGCFQALTAGGATFGGSIAIYGSK